MKYSEEFDPEKMNVAGGLCFEKSHQFYKQKHLCSCHRGLTYGRKKGKDLSSPNWRTKGKPTVFENAEDKIMDEQFQIAWRAFVALGCYNLLRVRRHP
jgi:hypothetical protein